MISKSTVLSKRQLSKSKVLSKRQDPLARPLDFSGQWAQHRGSVADWTDCLPFTSFIVQCTPESSVWCTSKCKLGHQKVICCSPLSAGNMQNSRINYEIPQHTRPAEVLKNLTSYQFQNLVFQTFFAASKSSPAIPAYDKGNIQKAPKKTLHVFYVITRRRQVDWVDWMGWIFGWGEEQSTLYLRFQHLNLESDSKKF